MSDMLPLRLDGKPVRAPKKPHVGAGSERPTWSEYRPKVPVDCDDCVQIAYDTAMDGEPFPGIRTARRRRQRNGQNYYMCSEHARAQEERDRRDYADVAGKGTRSNGQRYIA